MSLRAPLSVTIDDGVVARNVTRYASGLRIRRTAPGGDHSAEISLNLPRDFFTDLGGGDAIRVDDATGRTIWRGFCDNPGRIEGVTGQGFDLSATGVQVLAQDQRLALFYRDTDLSGFEEPAISGVTNANVSTSDDPDEAIAGDGLLTQFSNGQPIDTGSWAVGSYNRIANAGLELGAVKASHKAGSGATTGYLAQMANISFSVVPSTTPATARLYIGDDFTAGVNATSVRLRRSGGATNIATDTVWLWWHNVAILQRRYLESGALADDGADMVTADYVTADAVVWDLLTRMLPQVDLRQAVVEVADDPAEIDQLAFPEGATAGEVLDHLGEHEADFYWSIEPGSDGRLAFAWRQWSDDEPRYEISTADGFDQPGGDFELCNRVSVAWTDSRGRPQVTVVYAASSASATITHADGSTFAIGAEAAVFSTALSSLEQTGRIKDAETVELPDGRGSASNALRIGKAVLRAAANPPDSGTATVRRPLKNLIEGGWDMPWEIRPGRPVRVRETGQVIRLTETEFDDDDCSTVLTLGNPQQDTDRIVATLPAVARRVA